MDVFVYVCVCVCVCVGGGSNEFLMVPSLDSLLHLWIILSINVSSLSLLYCLVRSLQNCSHLLVKDICCVFFCVVCHFPIRVRCDT